MSLFRKLVGIFQAAGVALRKRLLSGLPAVFVEDVFSTYLFDGNSSTQTITNSIDLSTKGGLVWIKQRSAPSTAHSLTDTARGAGKQLFSSNTNAEDVDATVVSAFTSTGFSLGSYANTNASTENYVSWTFRKQPKFFDVVTWSGNGASNHRIPHSLGATVGCIIVKRLDSTSDWFVWHRSVNTTTEPYLYLNQSGASQFGDTNFWGTSNPTSTDFGVGAYSGVNADGSAYVAYVFAHNAGGFGLTGTDNVISCGSVVTGNVSTNVDVNLGYEPQWILMKNTTGTSQWFLVDVMRGWVASDTTNQAKPLFANLTNAESSGTNFVKPTATGFTVISDNLGDAQTWIYIAIRRPMKVPTVGTSVYLPYTAAKASGGVLVDTGFDVDFILDADRAGAGFNHGTATRLIGDNKYFGTSQTAAEATYAVADFQYSRKAKTTDYFDGTSGTAIGHFFKRAPSFFDVVCYTGNGVNSRMVTHNLGVQPELLIIKRRDASLAWSVAGKIVGGFKIDAFLNTTAAFASGSPLDLSAEITSTAFQPQVVGNYARALNTNGGTYVAYLFATCAGVSKVGSYTGNDDVQTINCGFTSGARFVMIKRVDSAEDWFVFDTARGINAGDDKILSLNTSAAEVTNRNNISPASVGFEVNNDGGYCNASGGTYIFLAIA